MTDVLIAGAGPAGASLAILLGRAGFSVELHDRAAFPREKACGEGIMPAGVAALARLGVHPQAAIFRGIRYHHGNIVAEGHFPGVHGLGIRRLHLDQALLAAAAATPGVEPHERSVVEAPLVEQGVVRGAFVNGQAHRARLLVAADGVHSALRRKLGLDQPPNSGPRLSPSRTGLRAHFRLTREPSEFVDVFLALRYEIYVTPLAHRELQVALLTWQPAKERFHRAIQAEPLLAAQLEGSEQISELRGMTPLSGRASAGALEGCVLLGDAAGFLDPITGGGITQALLSAELLAQYVTDSKFDVSLEALRRFDRARERMLRDYRRLTSMVLTAARIPLAVPMLVRLLRQSPGLFSHLLGVSGGVRRLVGGATV